METIKAFINSDSDGIRALLPGGQWRYAPDPVGKRISGQKRDFLSSFLVVFDA
jgi:hypothetical protein